MTVRPITRTAALRRERWRSMPVDAAHRPTFTSLGRAAPLTAALAAAGVDGRPHPGRSPGWAPGVYRTRRH
jgi:hypothetical protein